MIPAHWTLNGTSYGGHAALVRLLKSGRTSPPSSIRLAPVRHQLDSQQVATIVGLARLKNGLGSHHAPRLGIDLPNTAQEIDELAGELGMFWAREDNCIRTSVAFQEGVKPAGMPAQFRYAS
jgi:hypothetical protein